MSAHVLVHLLEGVALGFGVDEQDDEELYGHHRGKEGERQSARMPGDDREAEAR